MTDSLPNSRFLSLALSPKVVKTAIKMSVIVGTVLALINHSEALSTLSFNATNLMQICLTYLVPYCVSTYSSVKAIQSLSSNTVQK